ncbi:hypothetical protein [Antrihabitans stalactiti]|uniref:Phage tail protein n=1 Tax=Antrihabitans stalactiti TaxID=2584121 RepID=A0A848KSW1_9NOCA|nr:hypothetical protein [Antrihabitans stalactiti]NMN99592.1 hypothetical protein [Antrihabitans stalactiti]
MPPQPPSVRKLALTIDGKTIPLLGASGGHIKATVSTTFSGTGGAPKRQISSYGYADLRIEFGIAMGAAIRDWINAFLGGMQTAKSGTVLELDQNNRVKAFHDFTGARITELIVPQCDASSTAAGKFTLIAAVSKVVPRAGDGSLVTFGPDATKPWLPANFRITIPGVPTTHVSIIDTFSFRRQSNSTVPGDLVTTVSELDVKQWQAWIDDFVIAGHNAQSNEKSGAIEWLAPNFSTVLGKLTLNQIGIFELARAETSGYRASLYFETSQLVQ